MRIEQFTQLIEIVNHSSMTRAAEKLHISQPALSISMKNFEKDLGFPVFSKIGKNLKLTHKGEEVYNCAKRVVGEINLIEKIGLDPEEEKHTLNISNSFSTLAKDTMIDIYNRYSKKNIVCRFEDCSISAGIDNVASGISEIGIIRYPAYKQTHLNRIFESRNIENHILDTENVCVVAGKNNPVYYIENDTISVSHIQQYKFITYINELHDSIWMSFLNDMKLDYSRISLANVGHVISSIKNTDLLFIDTKKDHTHKDWYDEIRYIELRPEIKCTLSYIKVKNRQLSEIAHSYISLLTERISDWHRLR